jgi:hypothetical protein
MAWFGTLALLVAVGCSNNHRGRGPSGGSPSRPSGGGTGTTTDPTGPATGVVGSWSGTWTTDLVAGASGRFSAEWSQEGIWVSGDLYMDSPCLGDATVTGNLTDGVLDLYATDGDAEVTLSGTISGDTGTGTYTLSGGPCTSDRGRWAATRD